jgi:hypothetical protein
MQKLHAQAIRLVKKGQRIADEIFKYNLGTNGNKMPVKDIQHLIAVLGKHCAGLYGDLEEKENKCVQ